MALGGLGASLAEQPEALKAVLRAAVDEDSDVRKAAIKALGGLGASLATQPEALKAVLRAADDEEWCVREAAIAGVKRTGCKSGHTARGAQGRASGCGR